MRLGLRSNQALFSEPLKWMKGLIRFLAENALRLGHLIVWPFSQIHRLITKTYYTLFGFRYSDTIDNQSIRLIRLSESAEKGSRPNLTIHTFPISQCPKYLALSYTWGPPLPFEAPYTPRDRAPILLNGRPFPVLLNLFRALSQLCVSRPGEYLWVDSICINQNSIGERSAQVAIMDLVYNGAMGTLIWLGPETDKTERAVQVLTKLAEGAEEKIFNWTSTQTFGDVFIADDAELLAKNGLPPLSADDWTDLGDIYTRSWFGRVWMIQEVALSHNPTVLIGSHEVPWDSIGYTAHVIGISNALVGLYAVGPGGQNIALAMGIVHGIGLQLMREWSQGEKSRFREVLNSHDFAAGINTENPTSILLRLLLGTSGFKATYRRDRIYALLGIANHLARMQGHPPLALDVDYESTDEEVLTALGLDLFRRTQSLHLLSHAGLASRGPETNIATWIPTFENLNSPLLGPNYTNLRPFNACNASIDHPSNSPGFTIDEETCKLHVKATSPHLGTIEEIGETWKELLSGKFITCMKMLLHCGPTYTFTEEPIVEAFWRTLILDHDSAQRPAPAHFAASFAAWMKIVTIGALYKNWLTDRFVHDLFDTLEPLWILSSSRDSTNILPKSSEMFDLLCSLGLINNPDIPNMPDSERQEMMIQLGKAAAPFEGLLKFTMLPGRQLARTTRGYLCLIPAKAEVGDRIMIVAGCPVPLVLRRVKDVEDCFKVVGDAYVHGAMFGEHVNDEIFWRDITLI